jgi:hypothetical protein
MKMDLLLMQINQFPSKGCFRSYHFSDSLNLLAWRLEKTLSDISAAVICAADILDLRERLVAPAQTNPRRAETKKAPERRFSLNGWVVQD